MFDRRVEDAQAQMDVEDAMENKVEILVDGIAGLILNHDADSITLMIWNIVDSLHLWNRPSYLTFHEWLMDVCNRPDKESIERAWARKDSMQLHARELASDYVDYLFEIGALK